MKNHETTPLFTNRITMPSASEYIQPAIMGLASFANVIGSFFAISAGADKVKSENGNISVNPFFYTAMATSLLYFTANAVECGRIYQRRACTWTQMEEQRRQQTELSEVKIGK